MEELPIPLSRVELYLAKAAGMDVTPPEPKSRLELFLAKIAGMDVETPLPLSLKEQWLSCVYYGTTSDHPMLEGAYYIDNQKVDVRYLAVASGVPGATLPAKPQNRKEQYWAMIAIHGPIHGVLKYVTGTNITLTDVVSGIEELQFVYGDTSQQTYSGKNLIGFPVSSGTKGKFTYSIASDGLVTVNGGDGAGSEPITLVSASSLFKLSEGNKRLTVIPVSGSWSNGSVGISCRDSYDAQIIYQQRSYNGSGSNMTYNYTSAQVGAIISTQLYVTATATFNNFKFYIQLTSGTEDDNDYEPYVGGIPAPNPDYPQDVQVVTGEQTVTISDGVDSEDFTISLGSIELCKIGTYQDYIYKSGDDWYVHKEVGYLDINVSNLRSFNSHSGSHVTVNYNDSSLKRLGSASEIAVKSSNFIGASNTQTWSGSVLNSVSQAHNGNYLQFALPNSAGTSYAEVYTYFQNHPTSVYYALATPTDTQITDSTLVGQLDALDSAVLPKPIAYITVNSAGSNLPSPLKISYYGRGA